MSAFKGDYMGFSYGTKSDGSPMHSSDLGIVRTSNGSRFEENLLPTMQDKTVQVPGGDGTYYFGSYYTQRQFTIPFAFDGLTEQQIEQLRVHFGDKQIHDLIFDERPYKTYRAKVTGTATIKYIPFNEGEGRERVYKGEGSIQFTCYDPYAICAKKWLNEYSNLNKKEWAAASGLAATQGSYDILDGDTIALYNPGVKESDCKITLVIDEGCIGYDLKLDDGRGLRLQWLPGDLQLNSSLILDSKNFIIMGTDAVTGRQKICNEYIIEGDFFKIPLNKKEIEHKLAVTKYGGATLNSSHIKISYNYYYY